MNDDIHTMLDAWDQAATDLVNDRHTFAGLCPESANGFDDRDPNCPACQALGLLPLAAAVIRDVLAIHWSRGPYCNECGGLAPCPTVRALTINSSDKNV